MLDFYYASYLVKKKLQLYLGILHPISPELYKNTGRKCGNNVGDRGVNVVEKEYLKVRISSILNFWAKLN